MHQKKIKVRFYGERSLISDSLNSMLRKQADMACFVVSDWSALVSQSEITLVDSRDATDSGLRQLVKDLPNTRIIVINADVADLNLISCARSGVMGFVLRNATRTDMVQTIRTVFSGVRVVPGIIAARLCEQLHEEDGNNTWIAESNRVLTPREHEIVRFVALGLTNKEVGDKLSIAPFTVKAHMHTILQKLHCKKRSDIMSLYWSRAESRRQPFGVTRTDSSGTDQRLGRTD